MDSNAVLLAGKKNVDEGGGGVKASFYYKFICGILKICVGHCLYWLYEYNR